jgi:SAM-dependent methyltransferase
LLWLFDIYAAEAIFGRSYIASDLARLKPQAKLLEIGAGSLLLSCQLVREGFEVTGIEPIGNGFSHFARMRQLVLEKAIAENYCPRILDMPAEAFEEKEYFDYAFSVNVMEHVDDVERVIANVVNSLLEDAAYRFTCPNYFFPYEPHFNMPTLFSKRLTKTVFGSYIVNNKNMPDPVGSWESLNWINVAQIGKIARKIPKIRTSFNRELLVSTLERVAFDPDFASRRSPMMRNILSLMVRMKLHRLLGFMPAIMQPIIDCKLQKISRLETF